MLVTHCDSTTGWALADTLIALYKNINKINNNTCTYPLHVHVHTHYMYMYITNIKVINCQLLVITQVYYNLYNIMTTHVTCISIVIFLL